MNWKGISKSRCGDLPWWISIGSMVAISIPSNSWPSSKARGFNRLVMRALSWALTEIGEVLSRKLLTFDALTMQFNTFDIDFNSENKKINKLIDYDAFCGTTKEISADELKEKIKLKQDFQLIDVREESEYQIKNIGGILIPLSTLLNNLHKISKETEVVVHCASGARSKKAISILKENGFTNVYNLKNGLLDF